MCVSVCGGGAWDVDAEAAILSRAQHQHHGITRARSLPQPPGRRAAYPFQTC